MKKYLPFFVLFAFCVPEENIPYQEFKDRATIETLSQVEAVLGVYTQQTEPFAPQFVTLKLDDGSSEVVFIPSDTTLVSEFILENGWSNYGGPIQSDVLSFLSLYLYNQNELKVLVSGQIKQPHPKDTIPGLPFLIEKIETIPPCPVPITKDEGKVPLQNTLWKWKGFVNESNEIYSYPSCENPLVSLKFTQKLNSMAIPGHINPHHPNAWKLEHFLGYHFIYFNWDPKIYEIEDNKLNFFDTWYIGPNRHYTSPGYYTTRPTFEKADSLYKLISAENVKYILDGNQLILSHKDLQIRALFIAD